MAALSIAGAVSNIVDAVDVGREIYETTVNAMDAANANLLINFFIIKLFDFITGRIKVKT
jgi:hypothetical protein